MLAGASHRSIRAGSRQRGNIISTPLSEQSKACRSAIRPNCGVNRAGRSQRNIAALLYAWNGAGAMSSTSTMAHMGRCLMRRISAGVFLFGSCGRSEEHTSELQSLMRISYAVFCLKKKKKKVEKQASQLQIHS